MGKTKISKLDFSADLMKKDNGMAKKIKTVENTEEKAVEVVKPEAKMGKKEAAKHEAKQTEKTASHEKQAHGKKYQQAVEQVEKTCKYTLVEAVKLAQETSYSKFPGSVEAHINTKMKNLRGLATLPYSAGKKLRILAFGKGAEESGADIVGTEEIIENINKGKINFDVVVTTPDWMPKLTKIAKNLGPRGLMPNPKNGTITENLSKTVSELQAGKTEYKTEANGQVIHLGVGKVSQPAEEIAANIKSLYNTIGKSRITKLTLSSTMGPGVKVDLSSI